MCSLSQGYEKRMTSFFPRSPGSGVLAACSRHIVRAEHFSRVVSKNYCVIGQFEVGVVNALSAGAECLARVTCAAVGGAL